MILDEQVKLANDFQELHKKEMFVLPNIWDGGSARIYEKQGFPALATSSAGIAYSMGYSDGQELPLSLLVSQVRQICSVISLPLSVDMERGYGNSGSEVRDSVKTIIEAGAIGINIEDGYDEVPSRLEDLDLQLEKIRALVSLREEMQIPFVINGRTCQYWLQIGDEKDRLNQSIKRCNAYLEAGADCAFVPGILDKDTVRKLALSIDGPLNTIANPLFHDFDALNTLGVKRLSIGSGAARAALSSVICSAEDLDRGSIDSLISHDFSYKRANDYFSKQ